MRTNYDAFRWWLFEVLTGGRWRRCPYGGWVGNKNCCGGACRDWEPEDYA